MEFKINLKKGTEIFTIENCKIEKYYIEDIYFGLVDVSIIDRDISFGITLMVERYNDGINSYKTTKKLSECFLTKEDLLKQL